MRTFLRVWAILSLIGLSHAGKQVDVLTPRSLGAFEEEEILRVLARNKTDTTKNYTFVELISSLGNYTVDTEKDIWSVGRPEVHHTNPHYGESLEVLRSPSYTFREIGGSAIYRVHY